MPVGIGEFVIPQVSGVNRGTKTLQLPTGFVIRDLIQPSDDAPRLIVQGDPTQPTVAATFSAVKSGVALNAAELAGTYIGSFVSYRTDDGRDTYHVFAL